jgi:hypothetical protein
MSTIQTSFGTLESESRLVQGRVHVEGHAVTLSPHVRQNTLPPPLSSDTATRTDDDTPSPDLASSSSWDEPKVVALQSVDGLRDHERLPHVKDHTFALVRCGVSNLRRLQENDPIHSRKHKFVP